MELLSGRREGAFGASVPHIGELGMGPRLAPGLPDRVIVVEPTSVNPLSESCVLVRVTAKFSVKNAVDKGSSAIEYRVLTVNLTLTRTSGAALNASNRSNRPQTGSMMSQFRSNWGRAGGFVSGLPLSPLTLASESSSSPSIDRAYAAVGVGCPWACACVCVCV